MPRRSSDSMISMRGSGLRKRPSSIVKTSPRQCTRTIAEGLASKTSRCRRFERNSKRPRGMRPVCIRATRGDSRKSTKSWRNKRKRLKKKKEPLRQKMLLISGASQKSTKSWQRNGRIRKKRRKPLPQKINLTRAPYPKSTRN